MKAQIAIRSSAAAALAGLWASAARAHQGEVLHHHPHGSEAVWVALIVAAAVGGYAVARLRGRGK